MTDEPRGYEPILVKPFGSHWPPSYFLKWATIATILNNLGIEPGASGLDVGCGTGWTTLFLVESGYEAVGVDLSEESLAIARERARRWQVGAEFVQGDFDTFDIGRQFDFALSFDALHHSNRPAMFVERVGVHLRPGGWAIFGEPSWLHYISPDARRATREKGWVENGVPVSRLRRCCRDAGMSTFRRFYEGVGPYERRIRGFGWQLIRLVAANVWVAPQASIWLAARKDRPPS